MKVEYQTYLFNYNHAGASWGLEIKAQNPEDAKQRLARLAYASYQGEVVAKVPAFAATPAQAVVSVRNFCHRILELFTRCYGWWSAREMSPKDTDKKPVL